MNFLKMRQFLAAGALTIAMMAIVPANSVEPSYSNADLATAYGDCKKSIVDACSRVWRLYVAGDAAELYLQPVRTVFGRECDNQESSKCYEYGVMLRYGLGGEKDLASAERVLEKACEQDVFENDRSDFMNGLFGHEPKERKIPSCDAFEAVKKERASGQG